MPTPASSASSGSSSPPPHSFTTCPDDGQQISDIRIHRSARERIVHVSLPPRAVEASSQLRQFDPALETETTVSSTSTRSTNTSIPTDGLSGFGSANSLTGLPSPDPSRADTESLSGRETGHAVNGQDNGTDGGNSRSSDAMGTSHLAQDLDLPQSMSPLPGNCLNSSNPEFSTRRSIPITPSSFLRPGSKFHGTQQSERQVYDVQVEIKFVDLRESFLCGYLRIQGLTEDHPTLTTYFEGEIIGAKYSFFTQHDDWGANPTVDLNHWGKFSPFRQFYKHAAKGTLSMRDVAQKENVFMRWKEHFLVPDHRVRTITGASFEGFYYICFNQVKGEVSGIYFHSKSEKFQQLELRHVPDKGCFSAMELR